MNCDSIEREYFFRLCTECHLPNKLTLFFPLFPFDHPPENIGNPSVWELGRKLGGKRLRAYSALHSLLADTNIIKSFSIGYST